MRVHTPSIAICVVLGASVARADSRVAIGEVTGPTGAQVGYAVEQALGDKLDVVPNRVWEQTAQSMSMPPDTEASLQPVGRELGAHAVVVGDVSRVGRKWQGKLRVYEVNSGQFSKEWTFDTTSLRNLSKIARRQVFTQLGAALRAAEAAAPAEPAADAAPQPTAGGTSRVVILPWPGGDRADNVRKIAVQSVRADSGFELVDESAAIGQARDIGVILKDPVGRVAVAELMNVDAYVFGEVFYRSGWYYAAVEVDQGVDGAEVEVIKLKRRGQVALGNAVAERLIPALRRAEGPAVAPEPAPAAALGAAAAASAAQGQTEPVAEAREERSAPERARGADARSRTPLEVSLGFTSFFRTFDFNQPLTAQRPYEASFAPAIALTARWFPAAHFTDAWYRNLGLDVAADYAIGLSSEDSVTGSEFPTNSFAFMGGLRGRLPVGPSEFGAVVSFGTDRFALDPTEQGTEAETPNVEYVFGRVGADGRVRVIPQLDLGFGGGWRQIFEVGEIVSPEWFPRAEVGGFDAMAKLGTPVFDPLHLELGVNYVHYFFSFNPTVDDAASGRPIAGGALDQYTEVFLRAVLVL